MREIQSLSLVCLVTGAALSDLKSGKIPNELIIAGLVCGLIGQVVSSGIHGILLAAGGIFLPVLMLGPLYCFRMIGAGDIKLLCMVGGYLGPTGCFSCIVSSIVFGGLISVGIMICRRNFVQRMYCFFQYIVLGSETGQWKSYLSDVGQDARFCFSIPVLLGILCYMGGIF